MNTLDDFVRLKKQVEELKRRSSLLEGAQQQLLTQLKELCGGNVEKAKKQIVKMEREEKIATKEYEQASQRFEEKWKSTIDKV